MDPEKIEQKIKEIEKEIQETPYHKATEHHIGRLKARLAKLRSLTMKARSRKSKGRGFAIKKQGDASVVLVGMPSVGKSTLLNKLTGAKSKVGLYPFTTLDVIPGMMSYKGAEIQIFDVPGLIQGASVGKGRGREILSVVRVADLLVLIASVENLETFEIMKNELHSAGVRMNEKPPRVLIEKRTKGGIEIVGSPGVSKQAIKSLCSELRMPNAKIVFRQKVNQDQLIDVLLRNRVYVPALYVVSKTDLLSKKELDKVRRKLGKEYLFVSSKNNFGIPELKEKLFETLGLIRIYLRREPKAKPEEKPLICQKGVTVLQAAKEISEEMASEIKGAKIVGPSVKHSNQLVGPNHLLKDGDQVFFVK